MEAIKTGGRFVLHGLDSLTSVVSLVIRLYIANVFWKSGMTKIASWDTTLALFENEYSVPLIPSDIAAVLGTGAELLFPVQLALGLGTRFAALSLFIFNIVAVISYPDLSEAGRAEHFYWGLLLLVPIFYGPGKIAVDQYLRRRWLGM
ncbi:MAG: DoxX family protein [Burkholderiales bacterium]